VGEKELGVRSNSVPETWEEDTETKGVAKPKKIKRKVGAVKQLKSSAKSRKKKDKRKI